MIMLSVIHCELESHVCDGLSFKKPTMLLVDVVMSRQQAPRLKGTTRVLCTLSTKMASHPWTSTILAMVAGAEKTWATPATNELILPLLHFHTS